MEVYCPADEDDLVGMLPEIWRSPAPAYVRINHKKGVFAHAPYSPGKAEVVARGTDVTLLVYGFLFGNTLRTKALLEEAGLSVGLINMRSLKPVDEDAIVQAALGSDRLVTIEDHLQTGGLYSVVAEVLLKRRMTADVLSLSLGERWFKPGLLDQVLEAEGFTPEKMAAKIKNANSFNYAQ
jgi:transketolase